MPISSTIQLVELILQDINQQVFDTKYILNLGQLLKIALEFKGYLT
jgi:hypothetical protein